MTAVLEMLAALRSRVAKWLVAAAAALLAVLTAYAAGRRDGRAIKENLDLKRAARAREVRDAVERDVDRTGDPASELRRDWRRP